MKTLRKHFIVGPTKKAKPGVAKKSKMPLEATEQVLLAKYLDSVGALWCHIPNERRCSPARGARLKAQGVKPGVPDVLVFAGPGGAVNIAIELKRRGSAFRKPSPDQQKWLLRLSDSGWTTLVCPGAINAVTELVGLGWPEPCEKWMVDAKAHRC